jgi:hypothetical protein
MAFNYSPKIITDGLVLYLDAANTRSYPGTGTTWSDLSRGGNNGSLINGPTFNSGNGGSIVFDGTDDYVIGSIPTITNWTMCLWYLSTDITSRAVFYPFGGTSGGNGLGFGGTFSIDTNNRWYFFDGSTIISNILMSVVINKWYNLVVTKNSTTYNLYTNGQLSMNTTGVNLTYTQYTLGKRGDVFGGYAKGNISNTSLYNRALSATEIQQNYNTTKTRFGL